MLCINKEGEQTKKRLCLQQQENKEHEENQEDNQEEAEASVDC